MKNIKFRRPHYNRDESFSHFSYWGKISFNNDFSEGSFASPTFNSKCTYKEDEQFTGLKDCKDIDIYEGDIVNSEFNGKGFVKWNNDNSTFEIYVEDNADDDQYFFVKGYGEIIGNIHQNPKLIKP